MATPTTSTTSMAQWPWAGQCVMPSSPPPPSPFCLLRAGINRYLGVGDKSIWLGMGRGLDAIRDEFAASGTEDDLVCLEYVLEGTAGCLPRKWQHSGGKQMDAFYEGREEDGRRGRPLSHFVEHPQARQAALLPEHVVALRLYTTAAFKSINDPLRNRSGAHPFPVTVAFINDGIKRLRPVRAGAAPLSTAPLCTPGLGPAPLGCARSERARRTRRSGATFGAGCGTSRFRTASTRRAAPSTRPSPPRPTSRLRCTTRTRRRSGSSSS